MGVTKEGLLERGNGLLYVVDTMPYHSLTRGCGIVSSKQVLYFVIAERYVTAPHIDHGRRNGKTRGNSLRDEDLPGGAALGLEFTIGRFGIWDTLDWIGSIGDNFSVCNDGRSRIMYLSFVANLFRKARK